MGLLDSTSTSVNKTVLPGPAKKYLKLATPSAKKYAKQDPSATKLQGDLVVDPNAAQNQAQTMALNAATGAQQGVANDAAAASSHLLSPDILTPDANPALRAYIDTATRPIAENLTEAILPGVRSGASVSGNYGSSRQGIAEGLAAGRTQRAIGDTSATIANNAYGQGLDAMTKALGLAPSTQATQLAPAQTVGAVGDARQQMAQRELDAQKMKQLYNAMSPLAKAQNLTQLAAGVAGGGSTATTSGQTSLLSGALGGASLGAGIGSAVPGIGTGVGAATGAGLGALLSAVGR